jgi:predicted DNA-binding ribbon-helix-helix protein
MFLHPTYMKQQKRSIVLNQRHTSYTLEPLFHTTLAELAERDECTVPAIVTVVDRERDKSVNLSAALRLYILARLRYDLGLDTPTTETVEPPQVFKETEE